MPSGMKLTRNMETGDWIHWRGAEGDRAEVVSSYIEGKGFEVRSRNPETNRITRFWLNWGAKSQVNLADEEAV